MGFAGNTSFGVPGQADLEAIGDFSSVRFSDKFYYIAPHKQEEPWYPSGSYSALSVVVRVQLVPLRGLFESLFGALQTSVYFCLRAILIKIMRKKCAFAPSLKVGKENANRDQRQKNSVKQLHIKDIGALRSVFQGVGL